MKEVWVLLLFIMCMVVLNFIAKRNELTQRNAYKTLLFAAFSCMLFEVLRNDDVIIANFFVLLAMRRVISLRSQRVTTRKIFDASLWIFVASLFYFWAVLFMILSPTASTLFPNGSRKAASISAPMEGWKSLFR